MIYTITEHMYKKYTFPRTKGLHERKKFLTKKIAKLRTRQYNLDVATNITGSDIGDNKCELHEVSRMLHWIDYELKIKDDDLNNLFYENHL